MNPEEPRTPLAIGMMWASRVAGFGVEVALVAGLGYFVDSRFSTLPWGTLVGTALGFAAGLTYLLRVTAVPKKP